MSASSELARDKASLRAQLLTARADRAPTERERAARALSAHLRPRLVGAVDGYAVDGYAVDGYEVAGYVPEAGEPGAGELVGLLGAGALLPVVPPSGRVLSWARASGGFAPGRFGLLEPTGPRLPPQALARAAVVVVPALAVGLDGGRLGRGAGFYDRALLHAAPDAVLVGLVFDEELLPTVPTEPHDVRLHAVVTPSGGWLDLGVARHP